MKSVESNGPKLNTIKRHGIKLNQSCNVGKPPCSKKKSYKRILDAIEQLDNGGGKVIEDLPCEE